MTHQTHAITYEFTEGQFIRLFHARPETTLYFVDKEAQALVDSLSAKERAYITDPARGEYRGFAAWHDLCDANMMLPGAEEFCDCAAWTDFANAVMDKFNELLGCAS